MKRCKYCQTPLRPEVEVTADRDDESRRSRLCEPCYQLFEDCCAAVMGELRAKLREESGDD